MQLNRINLDGLTYEPTFVSSRTDGASVYWMAKVGKRGKALKANRPGLLKNGVWTLGRWL